MSRLAEDLGSLFGGNAGEAKSEAKRGLKKGDPRAQELVTLFADFSKIATLYPPNNERVQNSVKALLDLVTSIRGKHGRLRIRAVRGNCFAINSTITESDHPNVTWLAECMDETALGGIGIEQRATPEAMIEFASVLAKNVNASRTATSFTQLWNNVEIHGLALLEKMFGISSERWAKLSEITRQILEEESARGEVLREVLDGEDGTLEKAMELFDSLEEELSGDEFVDGVEFVRKLVQLTPENILEESETSMDLMKMLMKSHGRDVPEVERMKFDLGQTEYKRMLLSVSKTHYSGNDTSGDEASTLRRDSFTPFEEEEIEELDDLLDAFRRDYESLPDGTVSAEDEIDVDGWSEKLGIGLHRLVKLIDQRADTRPIEISLRDQVANAKGPKPRRLFQKYLTKLCEPQEGPDPFAHMKGFAGILARTGLLGKVMDLGLISPELASATFPQMFGAFVDALEDSRAGNEQLAKVCEMVGATRILAAPEDVVNEKQRERIYASKALEVLPFAHMFIRNEEHPIRQEELDFLTSLRMDDPEAAAIRYIEDFRGLPDDYVREVCMLKLDLGGHAPTLRARSEKLIRAFIHEPPAGVHMSRVVRAIGALRIYWSAKTEAFARTMLKGSGFMKLKKQPKEIRDAVKTLLKTVEDERK